MPNMSNNDPSSFGWANYGGPAATSIVPFTYKGVAFPSGIADILIPQATYLLDNIVPMIVGGLDTHDYGNGLTGNYGYQNRGIIQTPGTRSFHSYGTAIDVNATSNGQGSAYGIGLHQVPSAAGAFAASLGWLCGGSFNGLTDPMHFECHNSPDEIIQWNATHNNGGLTMDADVTAAFAAVMAAINACQVNTQNEVRANAGHTNALLTQEVRTDIANIPK